MMSLGTQRLNAPREEHPFGQVHQNAWHNRKGSSQSLGSLALSLHNHTVNTPNAADRWARLWPC